ncbi:inositolphosphorylceramide-B C-26 hydroxylase [Uncinocarpus reesii 1704]|uniref:Ceramide very long chain fatty acid hydroxylase n=1 Tax=Uncinocarpus reesii (strain UAMH 1704) TaxID=336963 RepID=C4JIB0_UNCRE|nr:inositolphosphorylceramide-B C-26 hydroxylase [Uncinocarpus reesii 1704]EEP78007.1 inositolphosphorylceramide-B C-26 hydroxylase [Uncinocarpus reesii 1704]
MPGRTLPTFTSAEVKSHNTVKSCWVTRGSKVYDVTSFVGDHPGGGDLILEYAGKDISQILEDVVSHKHSEAAYEILDECHIGFAASSDSTSKSALNGAVNGHVNEHVTQGDGRPVYATTGLSSEEDLSVDTDPMADYKVHKFLDLNRPLFGQLWFGGFSKEFYLEQVHRPRHYKGGASAPLFGNFLEPLTKTAWYLPDNRVGLSLHFLLHGIHHYLPMDRYRLVMPPTLFLILAAPFYKLAHLVFFYNWYAAVTVYAGGVFGYVCYDLTHYFLHHRNLPSYYRALKKYHLQHHFADYENGFGVTSRFWDKVFGTELAPLQPPKSD